MQEFQNLLLTYQKELQDVKNSQRANELSFRTQLENFLKAFVESYADRIFQNDSQEDSQNNAQNETPSQNAQSNQNTQPNQESSPNIESVQNIESSHAKSSQKSKSSNLQKIKILHEPKSEENQGSIRPDFKCSKLVVPDDSDSYDQLIGFIECKKLDVELAKYAKSEQIKKYLTITPNIILTNYREFMLFSFDKVVCTANVFDENLEFVDSNSSQNFSILLLTFFNDKSTFITQKDELVKVLSSQSFYLRNTLKRAYEISSKNSSFDHYFKRAFDTFKSIEDMDFETNDFCDILAQSVIYGIFVSFIENENLIVKNKRADDFIKLLPPQFVLLTEFVYLSIPSFALTQNIRNVLENVIKVLTLIDKREIAKSLNQDIESISIYLYEDFLKEYDKLCKSENRMQGGVFYTPKEIVNAITSILEWLLINRFNHPKGFADSKVKILDFATGTGSFLSSVYEKILNKESIESFKHEIIKNKILKDIYGFEISFVPYIVARLKLGSILKKHNFDAHSADFKIYLNNTLDLDFSRTMQYDVPLYHLKEEHNNATALKKSHDLLVILGNPPYNGNSKNNGEKILNLMEDYKRGLNETNIKPLNDDYIKFIRFAQWNLLENHVENSHSGGVSVRGRENAGQGVDSKNANLERVGAGFRVQNHSGGVSGSGRDSGGVRGASTESGGLRGNLERADFDSNGGAGASPASVGGLRGLGRKDSQNANLERVGSRGVGLEKKEKESFEKNLKNERFIESKSEKSVDSKNLDSKNATFESSPTPLTPPTMLDPAAHPNIVERSGLLGFITANSFLNGRTHRRMRESLAQGFDEIYIINLHGSNEHDKKEDKNVFDIKVGVCISIFVKYPHNHLGGVKGASAESGGVSGVGRDSNNHLGGLRGLGREKNKKANLERAGAGFRVQENSEITESSDEKNMDSKNLDSQNAIFESRPHPETPPTRLDPAAHPSGCTQEAHPQGSNHAPHLKNNGLARVFYFSTQDNGIFRRQDKFALLNEFAANLNDSGRGLESLKWQELRLDAPFYFFMPFDLRHKEKYDSLWAVAGDKALGEKRAVFEIYGSGNNAERDRICVQRNREELDSVLYDFLSLDAESIRHKYDLGKDSRDWSIARAKQDVIKHKDDLESKIYNLTYRPFDTRATFFTRKSKGFWGTPKTNAKYFLGLENIGICFMKGTDSKMPIFISNKIIEGSFMGSRTFVAPLYTFIESNSTLLDDNDTGDGKKESKRANFSEAFWAYKRTHKILKHKSPEQILHFIYATLFSPSFCSKYREHLKIGFPRVDFDVGGAEFDRLENLGARLVDLHLMQSEIKDDEVDFIEDTTQESSLKIESMKKEALRYRDGCVVINKRLKIRGVSQDMWEFKIGKVQVISSYFKYRKEYECSMDELKYILQICRVIKASVGVIKEIG